MTFCLPIGQGVCHVSTHFLQSNGLGSSLQSCIWGSRLPILMGHLNFNLNMRPVTLLAMGHLTAAQLGRQPSPALQLAG